MLRLDKTWICGPLVCLAVCTIVCCQARPDYTGLTGPYCANYFSERNCCAGRQDNCSVPIVGTLCYCDDFCDNRTDDDPDCCPDFFSFCKGDDAPEPWTKGWCYDNGKKYENENSVKKNNCNECKCVAPEGEGEVLCETNVCLMDQEIINEVNYLESPGWIARNYSAFWGRTLDDGLKLRLGTINPSQSVRQMLPVTRHFYNPNELPREFDARIRWGSDITPVQDQGWCGASWAISTVNVASDRFAIMSKGDEKVELSAQHLVSCNNRGQRACKGGYIDRAWLFMRKFGVVDDDCYPWIGEADKCRIPRRGKLSDAGCQRRKSYNLRNSMYKVGPAYRLGNETDIMQEILASGPVQATMRVYHDFFHYESGIYVHSKPNFDSHNSGYHSVRIVGWGEEPSPYNGRPVKFWRVANSWGRDWGEDGYFRIVRGTNECEIESFVLGVWANTARILL